MSMEVKSTEKTTEVSGGLMARLFSRGGKLSLGFIDQQLQTTVSTPAGRIAARYGRAYPHRVRPLMPAVGAGSLLWVTPHESGILEFASNRTGGETTARFNGGLFGQNSDVSVRMGTHGSEIQAVIPKGTRLFIDPDKGKITQVVVRIR